MAMKKGVLAVSTVLASVMLFLCAMISSFASADLDEVSAVEDRQRQPVPILVQGYVYEADGVTPAIDCAVNVTNKNTGAWNLTVTDPVYGWYEFNMREFQGGVQTGDVINVTATKDIRIGWNESSLSSYFLPMDVTMSRVIPEFPGLLAPVLGLMCLVGLASVARRGRT